jgi:DNA-binding PadR family transcriptional regulator
MPKNIRKQQEELDDFGRFSEPALLVLISLADGSKHGYAMTDDIATLAGVRMGPGTLYGAITRLEAKGLIERLEAADRRNPYQLTALGERALRARVASIEAVARVARRRLATV